MKKETYQRLRNNERLQKGLLQRILFLFVMVFVTSASAQAMIIGVDGLLANVLENNQNIRSFYLKIETKVFDPEAFSPIDEQIEDNIVPFEMKENGYLQKVVWVRDEYLLIETLDYSENPLNMYVFEPANRIFSKNIQENRPFSSEDLIYPYLMFFTKHVAYLITSLEESGINATRVVVKQREKGVVYQLGNEQENILVDPSSFRVLEINRQIQIWGRDFPLKIQFADWDKQPQPVPMTARFYINSHLFKEMHIVLKKRNVYTPRRNFLSRYHKMLPLRFPFSLTTLYSD